MTPPQKVNVFVSYSHVDKLWLEDLKLSIRLCMDLKRFRRVEEIKMCQNNMRTKHAFIPGYELL